MEQVFWENKPASDRIISTVTRQQIYDSAELLWCEYEDSLGEVELYRMEYKVCQEIWHNYDKKKLLIAFDIRDSNRTSDKAEQDLTEWYFQLKIASFGVMLINDNRHQSRLISITSQLEKYKLKVISIIDRSH